MSRSKLQNQCEGQLVQCQGH